jgi:hypothetical protein
MAEETLKFINPWKIFNGAMIPNWLLGRPEVSQGAKVCYARLCQFAGKTGECFPKQRTLALEIGVKSRQVRNYLNELEDLKLIFPVKFDFQSQNQYRFLYHQWMGDDIPKRQYIATLERQKSAGLERQDNAALHNIKARESVLIDSKEQYEQRILQFFDSVDKGKENLWLEHLKKAFPGRDIVSELQRMRVWLISNPEKRRKNFKRFALSWMNRPHAQKEKAGERLFPVDKFTDSWINERLGRHATPELIKTVLLEIGNEELWPRVDRFLRKQFPGCDGRSFALAVRYAQEEAQANRAEFQRMVASIGNKA